MNATDHPFADLTDRAAAIASITARAIERHDPSKPEPTLGEMAMLRVHLSRMLKRVDGLMEVYST